MKKVVLTLTLAAFAFAANAQFVIGGQLGFNTNGGRTANETNNGGTSAAWNVPATASSNLTILPKVGYQLNDNMQVGAQLGLTYNFTRTYGAIYGAAYTPAFDKAEDWQNQWNMGFQIAPYFRYNVTEFGNFTLFCEAALPININGKTHFKDHATEISAVQPAVDTAYVGNTNGGSFGITITPGLNYKLNDNISLDLYVDLLGLGFVHGWNRTYVDNSTSGTTNTRDTRVSTNRFYFTANMNAQTVAAHLNLFRIGFNYHF